MSNLVLAAVFAVLVSCQASDKPKYQVGPEVDAPSRPIDARPIDAFVPQDARVYMDAPPPVQRSCRNKPGATIFNGTESLTLGFDCGSYTAGSATAHLKNVNNVETSIPIVYTFICGATPMSFPATEIMHVSEIVNGFDIICD